MTMTTTHPQSAEIIAALPLRPRPALYVEATPDARATFRSFLILETSDDPEDAGSASIIGLAVPDPAEGSGWYLGCIGCRAEIAEADSGMCQGCRVDKAFEDEQRYPEWVVTSR
jgi:hypothetical protein